MARSPLRGRRAPARHRRRLRSDRPGARTAPELRRPRRKGTLRSSQTVETQERPRKRYGLRGPLTLPASPPQSRLIGKSEPRGEWAAHRFVGWTAPASARRSPRRDPPGVVASVHAASTEPAPSSSDGCREEVGWAHGNEYKEGSSGIPVWHSCDEVLRQGAQALKPGRGLQTVDL